MLKNKTLTLIISFLSLFALLSCNKSDGTNFSINGKIDGIEDGRKVSLKIQEDKKIITIDSVQLKNGKFLFKGTIEEPTYFGIFIDKINQGIFPIIDKGNNLEIEVFKDSLYASKIKGSPLQDEITRLYDEKKEISKKMQPLFSEFQIAQKNKDTIRRNEINKQLRKIQEEVSLNDWKYIKSNPDSPISTVVIGNLMRDPNFRDSCRIGFNNLTDKVKNSKIAAPLKEYFTQEQAKLDAAKKTVEELNQK